MSEVLIEKSIMQLAEEFQYQIDLLDDDEEFTITDIIFSYVNLYEKESTQNENLIALIYLLRNYFDYSIDDQKLENLFNVINQHVEENYNVDNINNGYDNGYVYVLINTSFEGMVKVGKTTKDPEERAKELSNATGVPTPFILVYKQYFTDCSIAEKTIHTLLEEQGYRISNNREFFNVPVEYVIRLIQELTLKEENQSYQNNIDYIEGKDYSINEVIEKLLEEGNNYLNGLGNQLQDVYEAIKTFEKAAELGSARAYLELGQLYTDESVYGLSEKELSIDKALDYYKEGITKSAIESRFCYAEMAKIYSGQLDWKSPRESSYINVKNALKCWDAYFQDYSFEDADFNDALYMESYLASCIDNGWEINTDYNIKISHFLYLFIDQNSTLYSRKDDIRKYIYNHFETDSLIKDIEYLSTKVAKINHYDEFDNKNSKLNLEINYGMLRINDIVHVSSYFGSSLAKIIVIIKDGKEIEKANENEVVDIFLDRPIEDHALSDIGDPFLGLLGRYNYEKKTKRAYEYTESIQSIDNRSLNKLKTKGNNHKENLAIEKIKSNSEKNITSDDKLNKGKDDTKISFFNKIKKHFKY